MPQTNGTPQRSFFLVHESTLGQPDLQQAGTEIFKPYPIAGSPESAIAISSSGYS